MHRVRVAEGMGCYRDRERHPVGSSGAHILIQTGADGTIGDLLDACLLRSADAFITPLHRNFQRGYHHLQLTDIVNIRKWYQPASARPAVLAALFVPLRECGQPVQKGRVVPGKNHIGSAPGLFYMRAPVFPRVANSNPASHLLPIRYKIPGLQG